MVSTAYQYLKTGKAPQDTDDLFAPRTGGTLKGGAPERILTPGYQKDVIEAIHNRPSDIAYGKLNPLFRAVLDVTRNQGWTQTDVGPRYGPVADQSANAFERMKSYLGHVLHAYEPITEQNFNKNPILGEKSNMSAGERIAGVRQAPKWIGNPKNTESQNYYAHQDWLKANDPSKVRKYARGGAVAKQFPASASKPLRPRTPAAVQSA